MIRIPIPNEMEAPVELCRVNSKDLSMFYKHVKISSDVSTGNIDLHFDSTHYSFICRNSGEDRTWTVRGPEGKDKYWLQADVMPIVGDIINAHLKGKETIVWDFRIENALFPISCYETLHVRHLLIITCPKFSKFSEISSTQKSSKSDDSTHYLTSGEIQKTSWRAGKSFHLLQFQHEFLQFFENFEEISSESLSKVIKNLINDGGKSGIKWNFAANCLLDPSELMAILGEVEKEFQFQEKFTTAQKSRGYKKALSLELSKTTELNILVDLPLGMDDLPKLVIQLEEKGTASTYTPILYNLGVQHWQITSKIRPKLTGFMDNLSRSHPNSSAVPKIFGIFDWILCYLDFILFNILFYPIFLCLMCWFTREMPRDVYLIHIMWHIIFWFLNFLGYRRLNDRLHDVPDTP